MRARTVIKILQNINESIYNVYSPLILTGIRSRSHARAHAHSTALQHSTRCQSRLPTKNGAHFCWQPSSVATGHHRHITPLLDSGRPPAVPLPTGCPASAPSAAAAARRRADTGAALLCARLPSACRLAARSPPRVGSGLGDILIHTPHLPRWLRIWRAEWESALPARHLRAPAAR